LAQDYRDRCERGIAATGAKTPTYRDCCALEYRGGCEGSYAPVNL
jgi:hypothetical protein